MKNAILTSLVLFLAGLTISASHFDSSAIAPSKVVIWNIWPIRNVYGQTGFAGQDLLAEKWEKNLASKRKINKKIIQLPRVQYMNG